MTKTICKSYLNFIGVIAFIFPLVACAKPMPIELSELISESDLIAIVDVYKLHSEGKSKPGYATARVTNVLRGEENRGVIEMHWQGISIYELGVWVVFLKKSNNVYRATSGSSSFWKVEHARIGNKKCCSPFVVIRPPLEIINMDTSLVSKQQVYIKGVPREYNPMEAKGISIDSLKKYIYTSAEKR